MIATIELARTEPGNPPLPDWLRADYLSSLQEMAQRGTKEVMRAEDKEAQRSILSVIAIAKGLRLHGKFLASYSDDELLEWICIETSRT